MEKERVRGLLDQAKAVYDSCGTTIEPLMDWRNSYEGKQEEGMVDAIYSEIHRRTQSPGTHYAGMSKFVMENIFSTVMENNDH